MVSRRPTTTWLRRFALLLALVLALLVWVLNASRPAASPRGCPAGCATVTERQPGPLRVLSLNVLHEFPRFTHLQARLDLIAAEIRRQDPDIVCLQEVPWTLRLGEAARYLSQQSGLNYLYARANGNRWAILFEEGEAILSRYPLRDAAVVELQPRPGLFEHRVALRATAVTPWGDVQLFVTHLTNGAKPINRGQAASLRAFVAESGAGPAIIAGDFNATDDLPQIQELGWIDTFRAANPGDPGLTCCVDDLTAGPQEPLEKRIDYIFLVPGAGQAHVVSSQRAFAQPFTTDDGRLWASDHIGLLTTLELRP